MLIFQIEIASTRAVLIHGIDFMGDWSLSRRAILVCGSSSQYMHLLIFGNSISMSVEWYFPRWDNNAARCKDTSKVSAPRRKREELKLTFLNGDILFYIKLGLPPQNTYEFFRRTTRWLSEHWINQYNACVKHPLIIFFLFGVRHCSELISS